MYHPCYKDYMLIAARPNHCRDCDGFGYHLDGADPANKRRARCSECLGTGSADPRVVHARAAKDGEVCSFGPSVCPSCAAEAHLAGISMARIGIACAACGERDAVAWASNDPICNECLCHCGKAVATRDVGDVSICDTCISA